MGATIDGGWSGAADAPQQRPEHTDPPEPGEHEDNDHKDNERDPEERAWPDVPVVIEQGPADAAARDAEPEGAEIGDQSGGLPIEVTPEDQSFLSEVERRSVIDSAKAWFEFAKERVVSLAADHLLPIVGGRFVDMYFELKHVADSVQALGSDQPVLEVPLPPVSGLGFTLEIPVPSDQDGQAALPMALCIAPGSPSLTGGWALDAAEHDDQQAQPPSADAREKALERIYAQQEPPRPGNTTETSPADEPKPPIRHRSATACLVEIDLGPLQLPRHRKHRASVLAALATKYASQLRGNPHLGRFEVFIIADKGRRCGLWMWLDAGPEIDRLVLPPELG